MMHACTRPRSSGHMPGRQLHSRVRTHTGSAQPEGPHPASGPSPAEPHLDTHGTKEGTGSSQRQSHVSHSPRYPISLQSSERQHASACTYHKTTAATHEQSGPRPDTAAALAASQGKREDLPATTGRSTPRRPTGCSSVHACNDPRRCSLLP